MLHSEYETVATMIHIAIKKLLDDKSFDEGRRITLKEVSTRSGISVATLSRIANTPGYNTNTDTIDALCTYFGCGINDLLEFLPFE